MSNIKAFNSLFKQRLMSNKFFLYIIALVVLAMDVAVAILSIYSGVGLLYWVSLVLFSALDLSLMAVIYFSNFRFKYSRTYPLFYIGVTLVISALTVFVIGMGIFTFIAAALFCVAHILPIISLLFSIKNSAKTGKKQRTLLVLILVAVMTVFSFVYTVITLGNGFYGQGSADVTRNLKFELNSNGTYTVTGILDGRGDRIVVPAERNGKPVTAIDGAIFSDKTVKNVYLDCGAGVTFIPHEALNTADVSIYIDKTEIDVLKNNLISRADEHSYYISLANCVIPSGLEDDEVYITFAYSTESINYIQDELIPTWFGTKGTRFSISDHANGIYYAEGYDPSDEAFLYRSYQNGNKVMRGLMFAGKSINNSQIQQSCNAVPVEFDNVYAVKIENDNDTIYEIDSNFKQHNKTGYRYVLSSDPENLLGEVQEREGFSLSWQVMVNGRKESFERLPEVLNDEGIVTIYPVWSFNAPIINSVSTGSNQNKFIYGNNISFAATAQKPIAAAELEYAWYDNNNVRMSGNASYILPNVEPDQSGSYSVKVTASAPSITSLTSVTVQTITVQIDPRPLSVQWNLPDNLEYSGTNKSISASLVSNEIINDDTLDCLLDIYMVRNAGSYTINATLQGDDSHLYVIKESDRARALTITPCKLSVNWSDDVFTYDGAYHAPTVSANGIGDEAMTALEVTVSGANKNASTWTATAICQNSNYVIDDTKTHSFTINPRSISLTWDNSATFTYNGRSQGPTVSSIDNAVVGEESSLFNRIVYGYETQAGEGHTATASLTDTNYQIVSGANTTYSIAPKTLNVSWSSSTTLVYNGQNQHVEAVLNGIVMNDNVPKSYSVNHSVYKNVGSYSVTVSIDNPNYILDANASRSYSIVAKEISVSWSSVKSFEYDRAPHTVTATPNGVVAGDTVSISYSNNTTGTNVGSYTITAASDNHNYVISNSSKNCSYQITAKTISVTWDSTRVFDYDKQAHTVAATPSGVISGDSVTLTYSGNVTATNAGSYSITAASNNSNYVISSSTKSCSYQINAKTINVTWSQDSFIYDGLSHSVTATPSGVISGDSVQLNYTGNTSAVNAGNYTVTVGSKNPNYVISSQSKSCEFEIARRQVTVTWSSNNSFVYDGNTKTVTGTINGAISGDNLGIKYTYSKNGVNLSGPPKDVGTYQVEISISNSNYELSGNTNETFTITAPTV